MRGSGAPHTSAAGDTQKQQLLLPGGVTATWSEVPAFFLTHLDLASLVEWAVQDCQQRLSSSSSSTQAMTIG